MSVLRGTLPADGFTIIPNAWLRDPALSARAKGLLCYMASHAEGYVLTVAQMRREMKDGEGAVRSTLAELEDAGYLTKERQRAADGKLGAYEWSLGVSAGQNQTGLSSLVQPSLDEASLANPVTKKTTDEKTTERTPSASPRGARLPEDWKPGEKLMLWFREEFLPQGWNADARENCRREHEKFKDHWAAAAGQTARKKDWDAAWRNWMRRAFERRSPVAPVSAPPSPKPFVQAADEYKADKAARSSKFWQAVDELIEYAKGQGHQLPGDDAIKIVQGLVDSGELDLDSPNGLKPSVPTLYSGYQDVITVDVEEVTGS
jgi:hypothetical protein